MNLPASPSATRIADYLRHVALEKRLSARTQALYGYELERLQKLAQEMGLEPLAASSADLRTWAARLHAQGMSARSIALTLSVWRGWYAWLGLHGLIAANPAAALRAPKKAQSLPKALAVDDAITLANYASERVAQCRGLAQTLALRDAAIVELLYGSGLRLGELLALDAVVTAQTEQEGRGWVDLQAAEVHVMGKGSKRRTTPVGAKSLQALQAYLAQRSALLKPHQADEAALFLGARGGRLGKAALWQMLRALSLASGLPVHVHAHVLRHSFASHVLQSSGDLRAVQELLGHANIGTTQIYTRLDFQHLASAYDAAHPRAKKKDD